LGKILPSISAEYGPKLKALSNEYIAQLKNNEKIYDDLRKNYEIKEEELPTQADDYVERYKALLDEYNAQIASYSKSDEDLEKQHEINKENLKKQLDLSYDQIRIFESVPMQKKLLASELDSSLRSHAAAIKQTNVIDTIQSIIFDVSKGSLYLATGWRWAGANTHKKFSFFPSEANNNQNPSPSIKLVRNLNWPWMILGSEAVCVCTDPGEGKPQFVNVTFPGFLGVLSGMNNHRVALACSQTGNHKQEGMPVTLLFRRVLEEATTKDEALKIISESQPASSMNVTIAGVDGLARVELDPLRQKIGYAHIVEAV